MNVSIIGTGYVGLTTGVCLAYLRHNVTCLDLDERKVEMLRSGQTPIFEPYLTELLSEAGDRIRIRPVGAGIGNDPRHLERRACVRERHPDHSLRHRRRETAAAFLPATD